MRYLHTALVIAAGIIIVCVIMAMLAGLSNLQDECDDKGGKLITDRYNRTYCVEVIE